MVGVAMSSLFASEIEGYDICLMPVAFFCQSEKVEMSEVRILADVIRSRGVWVAPVVAERETGIIMDGNHRLNVARILDLKRVPCILVNYNDERVAVNHWDSELPFDISHIYETISRGELLAYKSTRHQFNPGLPVIEVSLDMLY